MADPKKPAEAGADNLADLVSQSLSKVGGTVFATPSSTSPGKLASATAKCVREIGPFKQPLCLASAPDGTVLVLDKPDAQRFRLTRLNPTGESAGAVCEVAKGNAEAELMEPVSIVVDGEQQFYVVDAREACVKKYAADGRWLDTYRSAGPTGKLFDSPLDAAVDEAGNLLVADANNNRIVQLHPDGELGWILESFPTAAGGAEMDEFYEPCSVCVGRGGILRVADRNENRVLGFDAKRKLVGLWTDIPCPSLVRMAADGTSVLVAARGQILRYGPSGAQTAAIEFPIDIGAGVKADGGGALASDARGNLLVIDPVRESILVLQM